MRPWSTSLQFYLQTRESHVILRSHVTWTLVSIVRVLRHENTKLVRGKYEDTF